MILALILACRAPSPEDGAPTVLPAVREVDGRLLGPDGRQLLLHGLNARVAGIFDVSFDDGRTALEPIPPFTAEDCAFLSRELGANLLRLPINWSGVQPEEGSWDEAYLDGVVAVVDACEAAGVLTLVDLHQDAYSKEIGEDGAPLWAIEPPPEELLEGPLDDLTQRRTSAQVLQAFGSLFANTRGLADAYAEMAAHVATRLAGHPGVVGLELMNEPVVFDDDALADFHDRVAAAVRAEAPDLLLAFEPDALRNHTDADPVAHPLPYDDSAYAPHIYTQVFTNGWASEDPSVIQQSVAGAAEEAQAHGAALLVGELGHDPRTETGQAWITTSLDALDTVQASWAFWLYEEWSQGGWGLYDVGTDGASRGALRTEAVRLLARPYPQAVDGRLVGVQWDGSTLQVDLAEAGDQAHTIAAPAAAWPGEVQATCDDEPVEPLRDLDRGRLDMVCAGSRLVVGAR